MKKKKELGDLHLLKRRLQREARDVRKKALGIDEDHTDTSMQRTYGEATKTKRALKVELFGSKSKASATEGKETSIEAFVREILQEFETEYVEQKAIRFINVDFFLPVQNLAIQVHGCYWHCCDVCYPSGPKNQTQRKNIEKDKQADGIVLDKNINLLHIWEHEIKKFPDQTRKKIIENISK